MRVSNVYSILFFLILFFLPDQSFFYTWRLRSRIRRTGHMKEECCMMSQKAITSIVLCAMFLFLSPLCAMASEISGVAPSGQYVVILTPLEDEEAEETEPQDTWVSISNSALGEPLPPISDANVAESDILGDDPDELAGSATVDEELLPYGATNADMLAIRSSGVVQPEEIVLAAPAIGIPLMESQLEAIAAQWPDSVPFSGGDAQIWIPTEALHALELNSQDTFVLNMDYKTDEHVSVQASVNSVPFTLAADTVVIGIPWDGAAVALFDDTGKVVASAYDEGNGYLLLSAEPAETILLHFGSYKPAYRQPTVNPYQGLRRTYTTDALPYLLAIGGIVLGVLSLPMLVYAIRRILRRAAA